MSSDIPMRSFGQSLPMELLKAREAAMARFRPMLRGHGLTEQQWRCLRVLWDEALRLVSDEARPTASLPLQGL